MYYFAIPVLCLIASSYAFTPSILGLRHAVTSSAIKAIAATEEGNILRPNYEIEPVPLRIGHGFDIHRMAPLDEAGQPLVIGGVEITHKDQKVR